MTSPDTPSVQLILDRSALLAYVAGSMDVAEPIHEVAHDGARLGVPAVVAAEVLAVVEHDASVLTNEGTAYGDGGDLPVIRFPG
ncbi:hypothetical protein [Micromonospora ureilytica]|uniref:Twitching motility protein PilT n=1 Tax=Micromonospora ureilytica TaxID=709868 RepID=A0ABS0JAS2_9ACTN|nr:hypothetical protein [Micromonospora ureilytica]MBG6064159.1 hypothetical protein [Micromonospora ureilytica]